MIKLRVIRKIFLNIAFFAALTVIATPKTYATIYTLGDSLSDTGALGFTYTNPVSLKPLAEGKIWVQYITNSIPAFCNDTRHCKFDDQTYYYSETGNNYAVGGAGVTFDSTDARLPRNFTNLHDQVHALTHNHKISKEDVITIWMGANDILAATADPNTSASVIIKTAGIFRSEVKKLAEYGAKVYVITIPDLGITPLGLNSADGGQFLTDLTGLYNSEINPISNTKNITLIDSNHLLQLLENSGIFDNSMIYCSSIIDPGHICGDFKTNPEFKNTTELPFIFADPIHPSYEAHRWIGDTLQKLIVK